MVSPRESQTCFTPSPTLAASCLTFQNFTLSVPFRCRWFCCTPRLMQEFNQKPQSGRVPKGAPEQTLLQRTKDHKQLRQGRKEGERRDGWFKRRDWFIGVYYALHLLEARVHCADREYTFRFVLQHCLPFRSGRHDRWSQPPTFMIMGWTFQGKSKIHTPRCAWSSIRFLIPCDEVTTYRFLLYGVWQF